MEELSYLNFSNNIYGSYDRQGRLPLRGNIELTFKCNLRCQHCYLPERKKSNEFSYEEITNLLDKLAENGCLWLQLTGGEPLTRKDFFNIYRYIKEKGFIITLFTNGTLITPKMIKFLKLFPPHKIEISLYGITKKTYEIITGVKGSFEKCMEGIRLLKKANLPILLKAVLMTLNKEEVRGIKKFADSLGAEFREDFVLNPRLDRGKQPCILRLSPEEILEYEKKDKERSQTWNSLCKRLWGPPGGDRLYSCGAGIMSFHIDPCLEMSTCILSRYQSFSLRKFSFEEIWRKKFPQVFNTKPSKNYICGDCPSGILCGNCPGLAYLEEGDPEAVVGYLCEIGKMRAKWLGIEMEDKSLKKEAE